MTMRTVRAEKLDLRLSSRTKQVLRRAAAVEHRSLSEFVLESALARAEETLADRRSFTLDAKQWKAFTAALDAEPRAMPRFKKLMQEHSVFETR